VKIAESSLEVIDNEEVKQIIESGEQVIDNEDIIESGEQVIYTAEVIDMLNKNEFSQDEIMIIACFGVLVLAALSAGLNKLSSGQKSSDKFEFEVDAEMCPTPRENKKAIKDTLKSIMSKNNAKTTLIA
jgi:hypothetical protein